VKGRGKRSVDVQMNMIKVKCMLARKYHNEHIRIVRRGRRGDEKE
jgi:hypothetical protein